MKDNWGGGIYKGYHPSSTKCARMGRSAGWNWFCGRLTRYASATMSRTAPITAPMRAGVQKEVLASAMKESRGGGIYRVTLATPPPGI